MRNCRWKLGRRDFLETSYWSLDQSVCGLQMAWLLGLLAFASVICVHLVSKLLHLRKKLKVFSTLPGFQPRFLLGNLYEFGFLKLRDQRHIMSDFFYLRAGADLIFHKEGLYVVWLGPLPIVFISQANTAEPILNSQLLIEKSRLYDHMSDFLGAGLVTSSGDKWRQERKAITPAFHFRVLDEFLEVMNEHSRILVDVVRQKFEGNKWIDPQDVLNNCVLDILMDSSLDMHVNAQTESSEYVKLVNRSSEMAMQRIVSPWFHSRIYYWFPEGREISKLTRHAHNIVDKIIEERTAEKEKSETGETNRKRKIFLDILLEEKLTQKELRDQIITFVAAGHHTVGSSLTWMLYLLGRHEDVQSKLFHEVSEVFPEGDIETVTKEHLTELKYMDCVMKECHRLYPSIPYIARHLSEDTMIGGYNIPKGTDCAISIASIHRDPEFYPDPDRFDPDRFLPENSVGRSQYAFIPFSAGPRNCIGQRYAYMKMKVIMCYIVSKFTVHSLDPEDKVKIFTEIVSKPLEHLRLVFTPRHVST